MARMVAASTYIVPVYFAANRALSSFKRLWVMEKAISPPSKSFSFVGNPRSY